MLPRGNPQRRTRLGETPPERSFQVLEYPCMRVHTCRCARGTVDNGKANTPQSAKMAVKFSSGPCVAPADILPGSAYNINIPLHIHHISANYIRDQHLQIEEMTNDQQAPVAVHTADQLEVDDVSKPIYPSAEKTPADVLRTLRVIWKALANQSAG